MPAPTLLFGRSRLPLHAWLTDIPLAALWGAPFIFFVGTGLQLTSAALASSIAPAWMMRGRFPRRVQRSGYALISVREDEIVLGLELGALPPRLKRCQYAFAERYGSLSRSRLRHVLIAVRINAGQNLLMPAPRMEFSGT